MACHLNILASMIGTVDFFIRGTRRSGVVWGSHHSLVVTRRTVFEPQTCSHNGIQSKYAMYDTIQDFTMGDDLIGGI